jgi:hypothetical protein
VREKIEERYRQPDAQAIYYRRKLTRNPQSARLLRRRQPELFCPSILV